MKFGLDEKFIEKLNDVFKHFDKIEEVIIYGSRAIGNYKIGSDIDLTIKGKDFNYEQLNKIIFQIDNLNSPYKFDISIYSELINKELIEHINRIGISFYKPQKQ